jgi:hypothetical protein
MCRYVVGFREIFFVLSGYVMNVAVPAVRKGRWRRIEDTVKQKGTEEVWEDLCS